MANGGLFLTALLLGGGTREGFLGDVILQFLAIALLLYALFRLVTREDQFKPSASAPPQYTRHESFVGTVLFCAAVVAVPLLQLLPLPPGLWTLLPGRNVIVETFSLIGEPLPWWPVSMAPESTWLAFCSLIPPLAVFAATLSLSYRERRQVSLLLVAFGAVSVFLGLLQLAQGPQSPLRFFEFTNPSEAVGFFANRNHYSALLYVATVFAACWAIDVVFAASAFSRQSLLQSKFILKVAAALTVFAMLVIAQAMARSRAGLILSSIALFGVLALALRRARDVDTDLPSTGSRAAKIVIGTAAFAIIFSLQYAVYRILDRFAVDPLEDARVLFAKKTFALAKSYFPFGTGIGTFVPVYALSEKPNEVAGFFANRAHNDVLEASLESGAFGLTLMGVFLIWLLRKAFENWRTPPSDDGLRGHPDLKLQIKGDGFDDSLRRGATLSLALLALHSFVDYPLRTSALMCLAAFCCALLIKPYVADPAMDSSKSQQRQEQHRRHSSDHRQQSHGSKIGNSEPLASKPQAPRPRQEWVSDKELPESWQRRPEDPSDKTKG